MAYSGLFSRNNSTVAVTRLSNFPSSFNILDRLHLENTSVTDDGINNPRWRTVLLSALGPGGHGYFALDITNIKSPKHLLSLIHI